MNKLDWWLCKHTCFTKYHFWLNCIFQIDLKSREFHDLLDNLNSCFEDDNLRILDKKLIGNEKLTEKEDYIVTALGKHMIQKLVGKAQVSSSKCGKPCPCAIIEPETTCPEKTPLTEGPMYIGKFYPSFRSYKAYATKRCFLTTLSVSLSFKLSSLKPLGQLFSSNIIWKLI